MILKFKTLKIFSLIVKEYFRRNLVKLILVLLILAILFPFLKFGFGQLKQEPLSEGIIGTYQTHDLPETVTRLLSAGLTEFDQKGRVTPKLAESWEASEDFKEFKFKLKKGLHWSDGTPIKSSDLQIVIPDVEVSFPDEETVLFKLKDSFTPFPSLLTKPVFKKDTLLLGTGPYLVKDIKESRIFITKITLLPKGSILPPLVIRFYPNEKTAAAALSLGEIQAILGVSSTSDFTGQNLKTKQKITYTRLVSLIYNTKDSTLSSRSLRQALSFAAPEIEEELVAKTPFPPTSWVFDEGDIKDYLNNKDEALQALNRAKATSQDIVKKEIALTSTPQLENVGKAVTAAWQSLGLNAKLRIESGIPQNFQALLITQTIPQDPDQYSLWHSTQLQTNLSKYSSPRADKNLEDGRKLKNEEDRKNKYLDFQKVLLEDAPATFLYFPKYSTIYFSKVEETLDQVLPLQLYY